MNSFSKSYQKLLLNIYKVHAGFNDLIISTFEENKLGVMYSIAMLSTIPIIYLEEMYAIFGAALWCVCSSTLVTLDNFVVNVKKKAKDSLVVSITMGIPVVLFCIMVYYCLAPEINRQNIIWIFYGLNIIFGFLISSYLFVKYPNRPIIMNGCTLYCSHLLLLDTNINPWIHNVYFTFLSHIVGIAIAFILSFFLISGNVEEAIKLHLSDCLGDFSDVIENIFNSKSFVNHFNSFDNNEKSRSHPNTANSADLAVKIDFYKYNDNFATLRTELWQKIDKLYFSIQKQRIFIQNAQTECRIDRKNRKIDSIYNQLVQCLQNIFYKLVDLYFIPDIHQIIIKETRLSNQNSKFKLKRVTTEKSNCQISKRKRKTEHLYIHKSHNNNKNSRTKKIFHEVNHLKVKKIKFFSGKQKIYQKFKSLSSFLNWQNLRNIYNKGLIDLSLEEFQQSFAYYINHYIENVKKVMSILVLELKTLDFNFEIINHLNKMEILISKIVFKYNQTRFSERSLLNSILQNLVLYEEEKKDAIKLDFMPLLESDKQKFAVYGRKHSFNNTDSQFFDYMKLDDEGNYNYFFHTSLTKKETSDSSDDTNYSGFLNSNRLYEHDNMIYHNHLNYCISKTNDDKHNSRQFEETFTTKIPQNLSENTELKYIKLPDFGGKLLISHFARMKNKINIIINSFRVIFMELKRFTHLLFCYKSKLSLASLYQFKKLCVLHKINPEFFMRTTIN